MCPLSLLALKDDHFFKYEANVIHNNQITQTKKYYESIAIITKNI